MEPNLQEITHHASWVMGFFLIGYTAIIIEEFTKLNKAAVALLMAIVCWTILFLEPAESVEKHLTIFTYQMFKVSQVVFFLLGALTIVETINAYKGFRVITEFLFIRSQTRMLWVTGFVTFFLSSVLDNLTTTIVMVSLISKLIDEREKRLLMDGIIVIAANIGGAWTPIGDVATTLLWIYGQVSAFGIMRDLFLPCLLAMTACLLYFSRQFKGEFQTDKKNLSLEKEEPGGRLILVLGICALIFVPIFKVLTGLPAFMGMLLGVGVLWFVTDILHEKKGEGNDLRLISILPRVDISIILFYLGVLLSINALESAGLLKNMSGWMNQNISFPYIIPVFIGLVSSVVDNVSLVAATIGMYDLKSFPIDSSFWQVLAYAAGTGGSILIVGSAAGVALMAMEKVGFVWYAKKMTLAALLSFFVGIAAYFLLSPYTKLLS